MTPRMTTGFGGSDARDDFDRARRRHTLAYAAGTVGARRGRSATESALPLPEVLAALGGRVSEQSLGLQTVPVDAIAGTVDRAEGFDRRFLPTSSKDRQRWERIAQAVRRGDTLPPVRLYKVGDVYFVVDGHHRVSVARALGLGAVEANVSELRTTKPAEGLSVDDLAALLTRRAREEPRRRRPPAPAD